MYKDAKISSVYMVVVPPEAPVSAAAAAETAQAFPASSSGSAALPTFPARTLPSGAALPARPEVTHV